MTPKEAVISLYDLTEKDLKEKVDYCQSQAERYALDYILRGEEKTKAYAIEHYQRAVTYRDAVAILLQARGSVLRDLVSG
jgi:hypothetical protein